MLSHRKLKVYGKGLERAEGSAVKAEACLELRVSKAELDAEQRPAGEAARSRFQQFAVKIAVKFKYQPKKSKLLNAGRLAALRCAGLRQVRVAVERVLTGVSMGDGFNCDGGE